MERIVCLIIGLQEVFGLLAGVEPVGELRFEKRLVRVGGGIELGYHAEIGRGAESDEMCIRDRGSRVRTGSAERAEFFTLFSRRAV